MQHRATYCNDVIPDSLSSLVLVVVGALLPILIDTPSNVAEARSHAPSSLVYISHSLPPSFSLSLSRSCLLECARHNRTLRPRTLSIAVTNLRAVGRRDQIASSIKARSQKSKSLARSFHTFKPSPQTSTDVDQLRSASAISSLGTTRHRKLKFCVLKSAARTGGDGQRALVGTRVQNGQLQRARSQMSRLP